MTVKEAIAILDQATAEEGADLGEEIFLFVSRVTPLVNVDLLIKDEQGRTLLTWRDDEHYGSGWHIPGGIIRYKEHAAERVNKVAQEEIGTSVEFDGTPVSIVEVMDDKRRNRGHFISMLYRCRLLGQPDAARRAGASPRRGEWEWHERKPDNLLREQDFYSPFF